MGVSRSAPAEVENSSGAAATKAAAATVRTNGRRFIQAIVSVAPVVLPLVQGWGGLQPANRQALIGRYRRRSSRCMVSELGKLPRVRGRRARIRRARFRSSLRLARSFAVGTFSCNGASTSTGMDFGKVLCGSGMEPLKRSLAAAQQGSDRPAEVTGGKGAPSGPGATRVTPPPLPAALSPPSARIRAHPAPCRSAGAARSSVPGPAAFPAIAPATPPSAESRTAP